MPKKKRKVGADRELYRRKMYRERTAQDASTSHEAPALEAQKKLDCILRGDSRRMKDIRDGVVTLIVTSPPYNVGKEYEGDLSLEEYLKMLEGVWQECRRVLRPGGRICINVPGVGRRPYLPIHSYLACQMNELGFLMRGEIIWNKSQSAGTSTAWGSWRSPTNPTLRDVHEYILVFSEGTLRLPKNERKSDITAEEFTEYTKSVWSFPTESAKRVGHPAPFPLELPARLIKLYSFPGDLVLDPFCGSGTTCLAARDLGRHFIGMDTNPDYVTLARERLKKREE
jgi:DNA modification methylase